MKRRIDMKTSIRLTLVGSALALAAGPAAAVDYYLAAKAFDKNLPDGSTVPMWGYVEDTGDGGINEHCYDIAGAGSAARRNSCVADLPDPAVPGPTLELKNMSGNPVNALRVFLTNGLPEPTSIVIPGQEMPYSGEGSNGPTWNDGTAGPRGRDLTKRVRSFGREAAANGGRRAYVWNNGRGNQFERWGSYIYHSGTHPQKQMYMGLYGAVTRDRRAEDIATGTSALAYPGVPYDNQVVLFYSDIDPVFNAAVANGSLTTAIGYHPTWFLVNGEPYQDGVTADIPAGLASSGPGDTRSDTLIRFLNVAGETHVPVIQGLHMTIHAEDGIQYTWQNGATGVETPAPREQYSAVLPPLKTKDAIISPTSPGAYAVYDGNGYMTNPSDRGNFAVGDEVGGMLRFLSVSGTNQVPVAVNDTVTTPEDTAVLIDVFANDSDPNGNEPTVISVTVPASGTAVITDPSPGAACCVTYTPDANFNGTDQFAYTITDSNGVISTATALVDVTVTAVNDPPVAADDAYTTDEDVALVVPVFEIIRLANTAVVYTTDEDVALDGPLAGVLDNDRDLEDDALTAIVVESTEENGILSFSPDGSFTYTPTADFNGIYSFTYVANDGTDDSNPPVGLVTITINPVNDEPVAADDSATTDHETLVNIDVLANDTDIDGDTLSISAFDATSTGGGTVSCTGICAYTPATGFSGDDTFTYTVGDSSLTDTATVTVTVNPPPVVL